ncbi:DUF2155 domain-containing protein [Methylocella sp.]|uniref:DUF2155 domain-containing protein n=1 Tax=Methylocella sp. TaxID=1978226 RepID=UPI003C77BADE
MLRSPMIRFWPRAFRRACLAGAFLMLAALTPQGSARADKISHPGAIFTGLDKITGRIISFEVATDETVQFGTLQITERACYTRPATEAPQTITFVEVDEVDAKNEYKRIFSGWMFAASPGLHGIEHPVYDIWLTDCKGAGETIATAPEPGAAESSSPAPPPNASPAPKKPAAKPRRVQPQTPKPPVDDFGEAPPESPLPPGQSPAPQTQAPQSSGPVEVAPPPGFAAPRPRRPATDPDALFPPADIPNGRGAPQGNGPGNGF